MVVVARVDQSHLNEAGGYALDCATTGAVGAPGTFAAAPLAAAPSPATGPMRLSFALARAEHVSLTVFDLAGRAVRRVIDEDLPAGPHARLMLGPGRGRA